MEKGSIGEPVTKWYREAKYLYHLLKKMYNEGIEHDIDNQEETVTRVQALAIIDTSWKRYCIEKQIKIEDYE